MSVKKAIKQRTVDLYYDMALHRCFKVVAKNTGTDFFQACLRPLKSGSSLKKKFKAILNLKYLNLKYLNLKPKYKPLLFNGDI
jgi:hypothetical protein